MAAKDPWAVAAKIAGGTARKRKEADAVRPAIRALFKKLASEGKPVMLIPYPGGSMGALPGVSDFIACVGGQLVAIEAKSKTTRLRPTQEVFKQEMAAAHGHFITVNEKNIEELEGLCRNLLT